MSDPWPSDVSRRQVLMAGAGLIAFGGCLGDGDRPAPIALDGGQSCDQCGMIIDQHPGPAGQTYYRENSPPGHDPPARFCSTICTYRHRFAASDRGWRVQVTYLTDYALVDYEVRSEGGSQFISAHLGGEVFAPADQLEVVVGSDVVGAMGPALVPFSDTDAADDFVATHGGERIAAESISRELLESL
ncbi:nitrous oxide reductase accessory protein NosL [Halomicroarcula sp. GCM10025324]|uniref:nitrous oxide reductase accessory protein NosL n=1 Tax=Haloarcula TaxID=2237 RepID=UPI0023E7D98D|nr:nitrous oxide reductase accessory protein NosL [Halomicroarcula sp. ZS-22-S1]